MKTFFLVSLLIVATIVIGWHIFEFFWDRKLFADDDRNLRPDAARQLMDETADLQVVDVRPSGNFREEHLPGAINVTCVGGELDAEGLSRLDPERPVLIYCDGGFRSRIAVDAFRAKGFEKIHHLHRGIMSWKLAGKETESE